MKKLLLFAMLLATVAITSCSKDSAKPSLVGKWRFVSYVSKEGSTTIESITGTPEYYFDFKSDGIVEYYIGGGRTYKLTYTINGSNVRMGNDTFAITTLTTSNATLYYSELINGTRFEKTIDLRK